MTAPNPPGVQAPNYAQQPNHFSAAYAQNYLYPYREPLAPSFLSRIIGRIRNFFGKSKKNETPQLGMVSVTGYPSYAGVTTPPIPMQAGALSRKYMIYDIKPDAPAEVAIQSADEIMFLEESLRKHVPHRAGIVKRLEELRYDKKWLSIQPDSEHAKREIEKKILVLKGASLESAIEVLLGVPEDTSNDIHVNELQGYMV